MDFFYGGKMYTRGQIASFSHDQAEELRMGGLVSIGKSDKSPSSELTRVVPSGAGVRR